MTETTVSGGFAGIVLAAGKGTRMKSDLPKVLHRVAGKPLVRHALSSLESLSPDKLIVVVGPGMEVSIGRAVAPHPICVQREQMGTADAVNAARAELAGYEGDVLILFGDSPFLTADTLSRALAERRAGASVVVLGFRPDDPAGYGRLILDDDGSLQAIVEHRDATETQRQIGLCNSGVMCVDGARLFPMLDAVKNDNAKGEYYLTDLVEICRQRGLRASAIEADAEELLGINNRGELARAESLLQQKLRAAALEAGVTMIDPATVWLGADTRFGRDVTIEPNVFFGPGVNVGDGAMIRAFSHIEGAEIGAKAIVGPYARLRPGTRLGAGARIGNFVETKAADIGDGAKVNHLSYIGDARVGAEANIGAGTITCNYDGFAKHRTEIGDGAFIGSNSALVAPITIGAGALVAAGSTITTDVPSDALALARGKQTNKGGLAAVLRNRRVKSRAGD